MRTRCTGGLALLALLGALPLRAEVKVAALIGDHMVVQQGRPVHVWGTAAPGEAVSAALAGKSAQGVADAQGAFRLELPALPAGGPHTLTVRGSNTLTFTDVWAGEVWVASGQSNMEFPLTRALSAGEAATGCAGLHLFTVPRETAALPRPDVDGAWSACTEAGALAFSAVAFHFGQELHAALGVHVGLIHTSWGGTPAEAWTPRAALMAEPAFRPMVEKLDTARGDTESRELLAQRVAEWEARVFPKDTGNTGFAQGFAAPRAGLAAWKPMDLPQYWEAAGLRDLDGAVWFRRDVALPASAAGHDLALSLGAIDDFDTTYWNGVRVGATGVETPQYYNAVRRYTVPARLARAGRNVVAVRVFDHFGNGGFGGTASQMKVGVAGADATLPLAGRWIYRVERSVPPAMVDFSTQPVPVGADNPSSATVLWNGMTAPLTPYPIAGAIWYQGEANASRAGQYRSLFPTMIKAWREAWQSPDLPFLFVQLASFNPAPAAPGDSDWAELREAQAMALALPHTGMAVALDIGEALDIHPRDKKDVGHRLALQALRGVYGQDVIASGPTFVSAAREGAALRVRLDDHGGGIVTADGAPPRGFAVAGADRKWAWADARIDGMTVVVSSPAVPEPVAVRYGWADNPPSTLRSTAGLPAPPFRSDDWSRTPE